MENPFKKFADLIVPNMEIGEMAEVALKALEEAGLDTPEVIEQVKEISDLGAKLQEATKGMSNEAASFMFYMEKEKIDESFAKLHKVTMKAFED